VYGKGGGGVVCFRHNIVSAVSHTYKQHVFYMIVFSVFSPHPADSNLRLCSGRRALTRERSLRGARSVALHRLIHRSLPQTWPTTPYTAPHPPSRGASREGGT